MISLDQAMEMAIAEAYIGAPFVAPNPKVGCVILDAEGKLLSTGYHKKFGQAHAEVEALRGLSNEQLRGAHVIVTLEPCAHEGKTPSCAKTLTKLPIKKVTFGLIDPNPLVAGQGADILRAAGIEAEEYQGVLKEKLENLCEEFLWNFRQKKVFVAMKIAQSLDGKIALNNGLSQWITGPASREKVHEIRSWYDAVLVGSGTVLADNPSLNIRHPQIQKENKVVILDRSGRVEKSRDQLKLFKIHKSENIHILKSLNLDELYAKGIRSVLVEGGSQIFSEFLKASLVNRIHLFTAPFVMGQGMGWAESIAREKIDKDLSFKFEAPAQVGDDFYLTGTKTSRL